MCRLGNHRIGRKKTYGGRSAPSRRAVSPTSCSGPEPLRREAGAGPQGRSFRLGGIGEGNATVEGTEPRRYGPHWGALGAAPPALSTTFVSKAALEGGIKGRIGSRRRFVAVEQTRSVRRDTLARNHAVPLIEVDPHDGTVNSFVRSITSESTKPGNDAGIVRTPRSSERDLRATAGDAAFNQQQAEGRWSPRSKRGLLSRALFLAAKPIPAPR